MKTVIYVNAGSNVQNARIFAGVKAFGLDNGWSVHQINMLRSREDITKVTSLWHPDGFIVRRSAGGNDLPLSVFGKAKVVFVGSERRSAHRGEICIVNDAADTTLHAARELLSLELSRYAYAGWIKKAAWSELRHKAFSEILEQHGFKLAFFDTARHGENEPESIAALAEWLKRLGGPAGVFAADDHIASLVLSACTVAKLSVPQDVAIVGVDNDETICEGSRPSLSSVEVDLFSAGRLAAEAMEKLMSHQTISTGPLICPALKLVRRESTRRFAKYDKPVADAAELIRREACNGISASDVVESFPCSRRSAESRFRAVIGHSILDEIRRVRLARAKVLLSDNTLAIDYVARRCGYSHVSSFSNFFRAETGQSPSSWRNSSKP